MKKFILFTFTTLILISGFGKVENARAGAADEQQEKPKKELTANLESTKLEKWPADYPIDGDSVAVITVEQEEVGPLGEIVVEFYPDKAPNHVRNFKYLANHGFYDGIAFHRVIKGFMIQGGDPQGTGRGGPGWNVDAEFNDTPHVKGILSMARSQDPNSAGSQFFICHGSPSSLNGQYTVFGNTVKGLDVIDKVAAAECGGPQGSAPLKRIYMKSVKIVPRAEAGL